MSAREGGAQRTDNARIAEHLDEMADRFGEPEVQARNLVDICCG